MSSDRLHQFVQFSSESIKSMYKCSVCIHTCIRKNEMLIREWVWEKYEFAANYAFVNVYFKLRSEFSMQKIQISIDLMRTRALLIHKWMNDTCPHPINHQIDSNRKKSIFIYSAVWWVCLCVSCICCTDKIAI